MVKAAYGSGKPAYGVGAGNATMVIDETADIEEAARNTRISKTNDNGSGCSADGNLLVDASIYDAFLAAAAGRGRLSRRPTRRRRQLQARLLGRRRAPHCRHDRARRRRSSPKRAGIALPDGQDVLHRPKSGRSARRIRSRPRSWASCSRSSSTHGFDDGARHGAADLRDRRQGPLLRHLLVRRRPHPPARAGRAGEPRSWCGRCSRARTPARSPTACR